jgi:hypothetical protein
VAVIGEAVIVVRPKTDDFDTDVSSRVGNIARKAAAIFASVFAVSKGVEFLKDAAGAASDLAESTSKATVVFGPASKQVLAFGDTAAKALGQSKQQAIEAAGTFGNLFRALGLGQQPAADLSTNIVKLASDLASFNNVKPEEALLALRSGLVGETEPLRRFGVNLTAVRIEEEALRLGLAKSKDGISAAAKAQAAYSLIMKDTTLAQGDFARTSDGLANRQRILAARFEDIKARVGQALVPVLTSLAGIVGNILPKAFDVLGSAFRPVVRLTQEVRLFADALINGFQGGRFFSDGNKALDLFHRFGRTLRTVFEDLRLFVDAFVNGFQGGRFFSDGNKALDLFHRFGGIVRQVADFVKANLGPVLIGFGVVLTGVVVPAFVSLAAAAAGAALSVAAAAAPFLLVAAVVAGAIIAYQRFSIVREITASVVDFVQDKFDALLGFAREVFPQVQEAVEHAFNAISEVVGRVVDVVLGAWRLFGDDILTIGRAAFEQVRAYIEFVVNTIANIIRVVLAVINGDWGKALDALRALVGGAFNFIRESVGNALTGLRGIVGGAFDAAREAAKIAIDKLIEAVKALPVTITGALPGLAKLLFSAGTDVIQGFIDGIKSMAGALIKAIRSTITDKLPSFVKDALGIGSPSRVFRELGRSIPEGMAIGITRYGDLVSKATDDLVKKAVPKGTTLADAVRQSFSGLEKDSTFQGFLDRLRRTTQEQLDFTNNITRLIQRGADDLARSLLEQGPSSAGFAAELARLGDAALRTQETQLEAIADLLRQNTSQEDFARRLLESPQTGIPQIVGGTVTLPTGGGSFVIERGAITVTVTGATSGTPDQIGAATATGVEDALLRVLRGMVVRTGKAGG